jgi:hypothetical protein
MKDSTERIEEERRNEIKFTVTTRRSLVIVIINSQETKSINSKEASCSELVS